MSSAGGDDPRDSESLRLLIENGVRPEDARGVLNTIKSSFGIAAENSADSSDRVEPAFENQLQFRRAVKKRAGMGHRVADATFEEFRAHSLKRQWRDRCHHGYPWRQDVFEFIHDNYGDWIERGVRAQNPVCQADIKAVDQPLYDRFQAQCTSSGKPDWLYLPAAKDAVLVGMSPEELQMRLAAREQVNGARRANIDRAVSHPKAHEDEPPRRPGRPKSQDKNVVESASAQAVLEGLLAQKFEPNT